MDALGVPEGTDLRSLTDDAVAWASQHGLVYGYGGGKCAVALVHAPVAVLPTPFPRASFEKAQRAMQAFNLVTDRITRDPTYLQQTLASAAALDKFTANLLRIHDKNLELRQSRQEQQVVLAINRSDYMMDEPSNRLLQVEMNTIASSFGALSTLVSRMHRYLFDRAGIPYDDTKLPPNDVISAIADAMAAAVKAHGSRDSVMVMIVQPGEKNSFDQQWIQLALWERHGIRTLRRSLSQIRQHAQLDDASGRLTVDGKEVALAYFRAGYSPDDYPSEAEWEARDMLEQSTAALCPSVAYQLAGAKKVQQDLASTDVLQRFLGDQSDVELLQDCFAGLWGLDNLEQEQTKAILQEAQEHPEAFVLKPQREGGGNNLRADTLYAPR
ncbi:hypothetical protein WJX73_001532 [Symbiochloris irregularis]|uniref:Glutathione synthetase n=1 Tax=Symbiochloris irregularis TaxID=706552 RepID=A0AAW1NZL8_9CHLO